MTTKTFARLESGTIRELIEATVDINKLYHASLHWVEVTGQAVEIGWVQTPSGFAAPPVPAPAAPAPTIASLRAELAALAARISALASTPAS